MFDWFKRKIVDFKREYYWRHVMDKYAKIGEDDSLELGDSVAQAAFREAWIMEGDIRYLIDYFDLRQPKDYRYFEKEFRGSLILYLRQYDNVRTVLKEMRNETEKFYRQKKEQDDLIEKNFPKSK